MPYYGTQNEAGTGDGQRLCARGDHCAGYRFVPDSDGTPRRMPGPAPQGFCTEDTALIAEKLGEMPEAFGRLESGLGDPVRRGEMVRVPFGPAIPLSEYYDSLIRQIAPELCAWAARVAAAKRLTLSPAPALSAAAVQSAAGTLARHLSVLLALQPGWMTRTIFRPPDRRGLPPPALDDLEADYGEYEIVRRGVDFVTILVQRDGTDAGLEIFALHRKCEIGLGEAAHRPELLDGVPCRVCGTPGLVRAELPSDLKTEPHWSRCPNLACGDRMSLETYRAWVNRYKAWAGNLGPLTCQRCLNGHREPGSARAAPCIYPGCECAATGHAGAA